MADASTYALVTPARNEAGNLGRLAASVTSQTVLPSAWLIVDNGSTDDTAAVVRALADRHSWIRLIKAPGVTDLRDGRRRAAVVRAFHAGVAALDVDVDVVVKLDADLTFRDDYFERQLAAFAADPTLGISSGTCFEQQDGVWTQRHITGTSVWGCARAYRAGCLLDVLPLEEHMGWDGIDVLKAELAGWSALTLTDLPFRHHRLEGERDGARRAAYRAQGEAAHYMGYRAWYLVARALHRTRTEPAALAMISGYASAMLRRDERCSDEAVVAHLRESQSLRLLGTRRREALGRRDDAEADLLTR